MSVPADNRRLLFVTLSLDRGGTERHLADILPRLAARGWQVAVYCITSRGEMAPEVEARGVQVLAPPLSSPNWHRWPLKLLRLMVTAVSLYRAMVRYKPAVAHFFLPGPYIVGAPLSLLAKVPIRVMSRRNQNHYQRRRPIARMIERRLHPKMTAIVGNSSQIVDELVRDEGCAPANVGLIHNGVDLARFENTTDRAATRRALGIERAALVMITVANLIPYKGHADLIRALGRIKGNLDKGLEHGWTLLCAGRDDGILWDLVRLARQEGIDGNVRFLGSRRDVPDLLKASDIGLLCSHEEGFPNAVIEGMAAGLPMIVTAVGGNSEAVTHDETGQIVPPKDPAAIAAAILRYLTEPQLAERCARASRARVEQAFSLPASAAAYDKLYTGLLAGRSVADLATPAPAAAMTAPVAPAASPAVKHPQR